ncbi:hypothetical protein B0I35DRAFT_459848 [Stachybotrys elegans]|uniref:Uncharacterized protein n=1 Tax=Stachybotrys elegans TaxID=80388 RepID=A0A8K0WSF1_9HYPO|nr:hypothetical protein B0I35DRAFT_459848 [Stachybotrys elegans]
MNSSTGSSKASTSSDGNNVNGLHPSFGTVFTPQAMSDSSSRHASNEHPAFEKSRLVQEILVKVQTTLRRMPGVSAAESNEIIHQLQEAGQIVNQETSQLVDALNKMQYDQDQVNRRIATSILERQMAESRIKDMTNRMNNHDEIVNDIRNEAMREREQRKHAEDQHKQLVEYVKNIGVEHREDSGMHTYACPGIMKCMEAVIEHQEEQVNNRRSIWVMKHPDAKSLARAMETLTNSATNSQSYKTSLVVRNNNNNNTKAVEATATSYYQNRGQANNNNSTNSMYHLSPSFQPPPSRALPPPPRFGPLTAGPPRAPTTAPMDRRPVQDWIPTSALSRSVSTGPGMYSGTTPGRPPLQHVAPQGGRGNMPGYRPIAPDFHPNGQGWNEAGPPRHGRGQSFGNAQTNGYVQGHGRGYSGNFAYSHERGYSSSNGDRSVQYTPSSSGRSRQGSRFSYSPQYNDFAGPRRNGSNALATSSTMNGMTNPGIVNNINCSTALTLQPAVQQEVPLELDTKCLSRWHEHITEFYRDMREFVGQFANLPINGQLDSIVHSPVWQIMLKLYTPLSEQDATSYLYIHIRKLESKACLVTRVIIDYVVNCVLTPAAWVGAANDTDHELIRLQMDFDSAVGLTADNRQPLLDRQARIINRIMESDYGPTFIRGKIDEIATTLLCTLKPLLNPIVQQDKACEKKAYEELELVSENAWELSSKILTSRLTFDFRFPDIGTRFSFASMVPIDAELRDNKDGKEGATSRRVALVVTPVITCRNDTGANISAHSITLADVITMM